MCNDEILGTQEEEKTEKERERWRDVAAMTRMNMDSRMHAQLRDNSDLDI